MKIKPLTILKKNNIHIPKNIKNSSLLKNYFKLIFFYINKLNYYFIKDHKNVDNLTVEIYYNIENIINSNNIKINFNKQTIAFETLINSELSFDDINDLLKLIYIYYELEFKNQNNVNKKNQIIDFELYKQIKLKQSNIFLDIKKIIKKNFICDISWFIKKFNKYKVLLKNEIFK